jgi:transposase
VIVPMEICGMYFKFSLRFNGLKQKDDAYYRLVESYRNVEGRVCHRTLLNIGFMEDDHPAELLNRASRLLTARYELRPTLFDDEDPAAKLLADRLWERLVEGKRIDVGAHAPGDRFIDAGGMRHGDVREVGAEWLCHQTVEALGIPGVLAEAGFDEDRVRLAVTQIVGRAVYPASELKTASWIRENSAICELTGWNRDKATKDRLYEGALRLHSVKDVLERHLSRRTNELFDLTDKVVLYDLTNTYFEGRYAESGLAGFGRSKEKRNDARLVVLALVVNACGFIKYSCVHEGNMSDPAGLSAMIDKLTQNTGSTQPTVVMDAGIATEANIEAVKAKGFHYLCVSRRRPKEYAAVEGRDAVALTTRSNRQVRLKAVAGPGLTDYYLEVESDDKRATADGMRILFEKRFEDELRKVAAALYKKGGVKKADKVHQRIGRIKERYPSVQHYYDIEVGADAEKADATSVEWRKNPERFARKEASLATYFLRTDLKPEKEEALWDIYNTIREIENTFRTLKTDLDLRPVYHKSDEGAVAHLHLGILAYWVVNTIRCRLKAHGVNSHWPEIVRIGNTQKMVTTTGTNRAGCTIGIRKCSEPPPQLRKLQSILGIRDKPFIKRKSVVHKPELQKSETGHSKGFTRT